MDFKSWLKEAIPFLAGKVNTDNQQILEDMLTSIDVNQNLIGIDISDLIHFFQNEERLLMEQHTVRSDMNEQGLFELLPDTRLLYIHVEIGMNSDTNYAEPCYSLSQINDTLSQWIDVSPDRHVLFSVVINKSLHLLIKVWVLTTVR